jgi:hypothetical protein
MLAQFSGSRSTQDKEKMSIIVKPEDVPEILKLKEGTMNIPIPIMPVGIDLVLSRFIGKVALEALAHRLLNNPKSLEANVVNHESLDPLRTFVRQGANKVWGFNQRQIHPADARFYFQEDNDYNFVDHEFTFLYTEEYELFFVLAIFGIEYAIDLSSPKIDEYTKWLQKNDDKSPLYLDGLHYIL